MNPLPLLVTSKKAKEIARIDSEGRGYLKGVRVPRWVVFFVAGVYMAKTARWNPR